MRKLGKNDWKTKGAHILAVGALESEINRSERLTQGVEPLLSAYALMELSSENAYMRFLTCWMYGQFVKTVTFHNP